MNLSDLFTEALEGLQPKVIKTIPIKPKWKKIHNEAIKVVDQLDKLQKKLVKQKEAFWDLVEKEAKLKGKLLQYNEKKNVIEILE
jgi:hypothetical protein